MPNFECAQCHTTFISEARTTSSGLRFCQRICSLKYFNSRRPKRVPKTKHCLNCSAPFSTEIPYQIYCSKSCSKTFNQTRNNERGRALYTYEQNRAKILKRNFGMSPEEYDILHTSQKGKCKICSDIETTVARKMGRLRQLAVDHSHRSGAIRGLLCSRCNKALGLFNDSSELLQKAIEYLKPFGD